MRVVHRFRPAVLAVVLALAVPACMTPVGPDEQQDDLFGDGSQPPRIGGYVSTPYLVEQRTYVPPPSAPGPAPAAISRGGEP